jgi:hypothetical protein
MIPVKGYATFDPLKHCLIGKHFSSSFFKDVIKEDKVSSPLQRIADETEEDFQQLEKILKNAGVKTHRVDFDESVFYEDFRGRPPVCPRDDFAVIGETLYATSIRPFYEQVFKKITRKNLYLKNNEGSSPLSTANVCRVGKDLFWDYVPKNKKVEVQLLDKWQSEGFRVHTSHRGYHSDSSFCVVRPGCIVSLNEIQKYSEEFPGWEVLYLPDQSWSKVSPFFEIKNKVKGQWWLPGEEHNDQLIEYINTWLKNWVGYVEETVFDVNMLSIDQNTIICNNYNKDVFDFFKKHKVEPVVFNFRHRYFWDGGVHCITQDLYREGTQEDYIG